MKQLLRAVLGLNLLAFSGAPVFAADGDYVTVYTVNATASASSNFLTTTDVHTDASGNIYYIGSVQNTGASAISVDLDPTAGVSTISVAASGYTQYAVKLNASGVFQWAVQFAAQDSGSPDTIEADSAGNVYIGGTFAGTQDFNPQGGVFSLTGLGGLDVYLLKLNSSGTFQWALRWGNGEQTNPGFSENLAGIGLDTSGNPVIAGRFTSAIDADPTGNTSTLNPVSSGDNAFIISVDPSGAFRWAKAIGGSCFPRKLLSDASGNLYLAGAFSSGTTDFNPDGGTLNLAHNGAQDSFVAKLTEAGALVWAAGAGSSEDFEYASDLDVDASGNVYATGRFRADTDFDPSGSTFTLTHPTTTGTNDIYVWKLTSSGALGYARAMQSTTGANEEGTAISVDGGNNVLVGGVFQGTVDFDPGAGTQTTVGTGGIHMFLARLDAAGDYVWHGSIFNSGFSNSVNAIHLSRAGSAYIAGAYMGSPDFDMRAGTQTRSPSGTLDGYLLLLEGLQEVLVSETAGSTAVAEGGPSDTYAVKLGFQNAANVTLAVTPSAQLDLGSGPGVTRNLTFTTAANDWNSTRTLPVSAADDFVVEGAHAGTITTTVSATSDTEFSGATGATVNVAITDNDLAGVTVLEGGGTTVVTEGGAGDVISVQLTSIPTAPVSVALSHSSTRTLLNGNSGTVTLNFPTNVSALTPQLVNVDAVDDLIAEGPHNDSIGFVVTSSDGAYSSLVVSAVNVSITDNDVAGLVLVQSAGSTDLTENGAGDSFTLALSSQPNASVTVTVSATTEVDLGSGAGVPRVLNFAADGTALNAQTVSASVLNDLIYAGDRQATVSIGVTSGDTNYGGLSQQFDLNIAEDEPVPALVLVESDGNTLVAEGGSTDQLSAALNTQPTASTTVTYSPSPQLDLGGGAGVSVQQTFPASAIALTPQLLTVTAVDDVLQEGLHQGQIEVAVQSGDANYAGITESITVAISDNDIVPGLGVLESDGDSAVAEGGATDTLLVALESVPAAVVAVTAQPGPQLDLGSGGGVAVVLNFATNASALVPQTLTVSAVDDTDIEGAHADSVSFSTASTDPDYAGRTASIDIDIADNDTPTCDNPAGCTPFSGTSLTVDAGDDVCLRVPDPVLANSTFIWERNGNVLQEGRFVGSNCRTLSIAAIGEDEGGTYTCTYDDGAKSVAVYTVVITVTQAPNVPAPGFLGLAVLAAALGILGVAGAGRSRHG